MTSRHPVPGGWVELRDPQEVTERQRRPVRQLTVRLTAVPGMGEAIATAAAEGGDQVTLENVTAEKEAEIRAHLGEGFALVEELQDAAIMARLAAWSFTDPEGTPLPVTGDSLLDLPGPAYDALKELCKDVTLGPDLTPTPDPQSPTQPSTA